MASSSSCVDRVAQGSAPVSDPYLDKFVLIRLRSRHGSDEDACPDGCAYLSERWKEVFVVAKSADESCYFALTVHTNWDTDNEYVRGDYDEKKASIECVAKIK